MQQRWIPGRARGPRGLLYRSSQNWPPTFYLLITQDFLTHRRMQRPNRWGDWKSGRLGISQLNEACTAHTSVQLHPGLDLHPCAAK